MISLCTVTGNQEPLCPKHHAGAHKAYKTMMKKGVNLREATRVYIRLTRRKSVRKVPRQRRY